LAELSCITRPTPGLMCEVLDPLQLAGVLYGEGGLIGHRLGEPEVRFTESTPAEHADSETPHRTSIEAHRHRDGRLGRRRMRSLGARVASYVWNEGSFARGDDPADKALANATSWRGHS